MAALLGGGCWFGFGIVSGGTPLKPTGYCSVCGKGARGSRLPGWDLWLSATKEVISLTASTRHGKAGRTAASGGERGWVGGGCGDDCEDCTDSDGSDGGNGGGDGGGRFGCRSRLPLAILDSVGCLRAPWFALAYLCRYDCRCAGLGGRGAVRFVAARTKMATAAAAMAATSAAMATTALMALQQRLPRHGTRACSKLWRPQRGL